MRAKKTEFPTSASKLMFITIGTSLFHSACWHNKPKKLERLFKGELDNYKRWLKAGSEKDPGPLGMPQKRRRDSSGLIEALESGKKLNAENVGIWLDSLAVYNGDKDSEPGYSRIIDNAMRYSAEIATVLRFVKQEAKQKARLDYQNLLSEYHICWIYDSIETSASYRAGKHNEAYLARLLKLGEEQTSAIAIPNFSGSEAGLLSSALVEYRKILSDAYYCNPHIRQIDLVVTGGYKIYSMVGYGFLKNDNYRVIYLHDESESVIIHTSDTLNIGGENNSGFAAISNLEEK